MVRLAGRLSVAQVPELLGACAEAHRVELDLGDLLSADVAGIEVLQALRSRGAQLVGAPGYLQLKLDTDPAYRPVHAETTGRGGPKRKRGT